MASIYRRAGTKVWQCAFYIPTDTEPKQIRKSTGKTNRREAEQIAIELERKARELAGIDGETAQKIHTILNQAGEDALKERLTITKARTYLSAILKEATGEELFMFTIRGWIEEWLKRKASLVTRATMQRYEGSCRAPSSSGWVNALIRA